MIIIFLLITALIFGFNFFMDLDFQKFKIESSKITLKLREINKIKNVDASGNIKFWIHENDFTITPSFDSKTCYINYIVSESSNVQNDDIELAKSFLNKYWLITANNANETLSDIECFSIKKQFASPDTVNFFKFDLDYCPVYYDLSYLYYNENGYMRLTGFKAYPDETTDIDKVSYLNCY